MAVRSKEQLAVMLKLIEVNSTSLFRRNLNVRQKVWQAIADKLNKIPGAKKDVDGWRRCYYAWKCNGEKESFEIISDVGDDDYFYISVSDNEADDEFEASAKRSNKTPKEKQQQRLHELVYMNKEILTSTADDGPLKSRIWSNITDELNSIPGALRLTPGQWKKRVEWHKYINRKGRKPFKRPASDSKDSLDKRLKMIVSEQEQDDSSSQKYDMESDLQDSQEAHTSPLNREFISIDEIIVEEPENHETDGDLMLKKERNSEDDYADADGDTYIDEDIDNLLYAEGDEGEYEDLREEAASEFDTKTNSNHIKPPPLAQSFKFSNRIVNAVELVSNEVGHMKDLLRKTTNALESIEGVMHQQLKKQDETNALLKRNNQLLKVLVEFKTGRRTRP